jgi:hypothetical protein
MPNPLVDDWIQYHLDGSSPSDPRYSAWVEADELLRRDSEGRVGAYSRTDRSGTGRSDVGQCRRRSS